MSAFPLFNCSKKLQNIFEIGFKKCEVIVQKSLSEKKYFEINNLQTCFCLLYVILATVQIWGQSKKFPLSCNSLKCLLQVKKFIRENSAKKNPLLRKQTPPTNAFNAVLRSLSQSALGKFFLAVKFTRESPKHPCVLQCAQGGEIIFL